MCRESEADFHGINEKQGVGNAITDAGERGYEDGR